MQIFRKLKNILKNTPVLIANNPFKNVATGMALAAMPLVAPIQDVHVDDMVKAYHRGDAKFSTKDKDWNVDWKKTTTDNQTIKYLMRNR